MNRQLRQWTKKIRLPGGTRTIGRDEDDTDDEDERNLAAGPLQQFMGNIAKIQKGIKRKAVSVSLQTPITPAIKQSPKTPESRKIPKFSFKIRSKGKRLLPKTPKKKKSLSSVNKTAEKSSEELATELPFSDTVSEAPWRSPGELALESIRAIRRKTQLSQSEERKKDGLAQTALKEATNRALEKLFKKVSKGKQSRLVCKHPLHRPLNSLPRLRKAEKYPSFPLKLGRKESVCYPRHLKRKSLFRLSTRQLKNLRKN